MSTNLIDELSEVEAKDLLNMICSKLHIQGKSRTSYTILKQVSVEVESKTLLTNLKGED